MAFQRESGCIVGQREVVKANGFSGIGELGRIVTVPGLSEEGVGTTVVFCSLTTETQDQVPGAAIPVVMALLNKVEESLYNSVY